MIIGDCPYDCGTPLWLPICDDPPQLERHACEGCGEIIWTRHSRIDPWSMTEADFLEVYEVDAETKAINRRTRSTTEERLSE